MGAKKNPAGMPHRIGDATLDGPAHDGFLARLTAVRMKHRERVPHTNVYPDETFTCGICHAPITKLDAFTWEHQ